MENENTYWTIESDFLKGCMQIFSKDGKEEEKIIKILTQKSISQISIICDQCSPLYKSIQAG